MKLVLIASLIGGGVIVALGMLLVVVILTRPQQLGNKELAENRADSPAVTAGGPQVNNLNQTTSPRRNAPTSTMMPPNAMPVQIANYPAGTRLTDTVDTLPTYLVKAVPFDVVELYDAMDANSNQAPQFLDALAMVSDELRPLYSDEQWIQLPHVDAKVMQQLAEMDILDPSQLDSNQLRATDEFVDRLSDAMSIGERRFAIRPNMEVLLPHMQSWRLAAKIVSARAYAALDRADEDSFMRDFNLLAQLAFDDARPSYMICELVRLAVVGMLNHVVEVAINSGALSESNLRELAQRLVEYDLASSAQFADWVRMEELMLVNLLYEFELNPGNRARKLEELVGKTVEAEQGSQVVPVEIQAKLETLGNGDFQRYREEAIRQFEYVYETLSAAEGNLGGALQSIASTFDSQWTEEYESEWFLLALLMPPFEPAIGAQARNSAQTRGNVSRCALAIWRLHNEDLPPSIDALFAAAGLASVPIDPFAGEPLKLVNRNGQSIVYSIGADGIDDQGLVEWDLLPGHTGDMVFNIE